ncbi:MAG: hypothetical protein PVG43_00695 [Nitrosopumilaceae archaeon]|jgi:hypothetical protein
MLKAMMTSQNANVFVGKFRVASEKAITKSLIHDGILGPGGIS